MPGHPTSLLQLSYCSKRTLNEQNCMPALLRAREMEARNRTGREGTPEGCTKENLQGITSSSRCPLGLA